MDPCGCDPCLERRPRAGRVRRRGARPGRRAPHRRQRSSPVRCSSPFVEHKPDWLHLLLLSRRRPALPVDRLRASGQLADVSFDALRFSEREAICELLTGLCPDSAPEDLAVCSPTWSDGWAAALQLTALAVRSRRRPTTPPRGAPDRAVPAGSDRLVDSYLWHEVLRAEKPELVDLLLVHRRGRPHELRTGRGTHRTIRCRRPAAGGRGARTVRHRLRHGRMVRGARPRPRGAAGRARAPLPRASARAARARRPMAREHGRPA